MRRMQCKCDGEWFKANPRRGMIQCTDCKQRYIWGKEQWEEFNPTAKQFAKEVIERFVFKPPRKFIQEMSETMGQWMKRHGITRVKKPKVKTKKEISIPSPERAGSFTDRHFRKKWSDVIFCLNQRGKYRFIKHAHRGKLRGRDIAKAAHRDLRRIGIETRLKFIKNGEAVLEVIQ